MRVTREWLAIGLISSAGCGDVATSGPVDDGGVPETGSGAEAGAEASAPVDAGPDGASSCSGDAGSGCYALVCKVTPRSLQENRDLLIADLAKRKCTDSCTLWAALNQAERYIFLMDTAYLGDKTSRLYPPSYANTETALDHAVALYSINGPKAGQGVDFSGRGGNDYNRIYLGFDALATCVMRNFALANPAHDPSYNMWVKSDDLAGPHAPFNQREMIFWYKGPLDLMSEGPQFHHWHSDSDFNQSGLNQRLGVCGVTDRSITELTIAFDSVHNSDPLGDYTSNGGYGWQIVDQHVSIKADWSYMPNSCPSTAPVNMDPYGGGTFAGMGPVLNGAVCTSPKLGNGC